MLFNSYIFIFIFLPITLTLFFKLTQFKFTKLATIILTISSFIFYGYWHIVEHSRYDYLLLLLFSVFFNHQMGEAIAHSISQNKVKKAQLLLLVGTVVNLVYIGYFKYANFLLDSVNSLVNTTFHLNNIILPLGISFYTFTQIAYLVDAYRGETQGNQYDLLTYGLFVSFFPQLIAGPILRHDELIPQFKNLKHFIFSQKNFALGISLFSLGLCKKVLIADSLSPQVATIFNHAMDINFIESWVGALSYTFQLYFDFSGYSDMAIGLGLMFNIKLPLNFNSPYKATSISDFWRRWHITLSNFLRDYLYISLGGSRKGEFRRYLNLMTTMLLGGLWHGAGWTFVIWGGIHGLYLSINHAWRIYGISLPKLVGWLITFIGVVFSWVLFRAYTLQEGIEILKAMVGIKGIVIPGEAGGKLGFLTSLGVQLESWRDLEYIPETNGSKTITLIVLFALLIIVKFSPNTQQIIKQLKPTWWWAMGIGLLTSYCLLCLNRVSEFLYFQF